MFPGMSVHILPTKLLIDMKPDNLMSARNNIASLLSLDLCDLNLCVISVWICSFLSCAVVKNKYEKNSRINEKL